MAPRMTYKKAADPPNHLGVPLQRCHPDAGAHVGGHLPQGYTRAEGLSAEKNTLVPVAMRAAQEAAIDSSSVSYPSLCSPDPPSAHGDRPNLLCWVEVAAELIHSGLVDLRHQASRLAELLEGRLGLNVVRGLVLAVGAGDV